MKKNKSVEVELNEVTVQRNGEMVTIYQLTSGKTVIGEITELSENKFQVSSGTSFNLVTKSIDSGCEELLRYWNLTN